MSPRPTPEILRAEGDDAIDGTPALPDKRAVK